MRPPLPRRSRRAQESIKLTAQTAAMALYDHRRVMPRSSMHFTQTIFSSSYQGGCSSEAQSTTSVFGRCRASANAWETRTSQGKVPGGPSACASSSPLNVYFICRKAGRSPPSLMNFAKSGETCIPPLVQPCLGQKLIMRPAAFSCLMAQARKPLRSLTYRVVEVGLWHIGCMRVRLKTVAGIEGAADTNRRLRNPNSEAGLDPEPTRAGPVLRKPWPRNLLGHLPRNSGTFADCAGKQEDH